MTTSVTIQLTRADLDAVARPSTGTVLKLSSSSAAIFGLGAVIGGGCATLIASVVNVSGTIEWSFGALVGGFIAVWLWLRRIEAAVPLRKFPNVPMAISISDAGIAATHASFSSRDSWDVIAEIKPMPEHLVIVTAFDTHYVLPVRDFPDRQQFEHFISEAQRLFQAHVLLKGQDDVTKGLSTASVSA